MAAPHQQDPRVDVDLSLDDSDDDDVRILGGGTPIQQGEELQRGGLPLDIVPAHRQAAIRKVPPFAFGDLIDFGADAMPATPPLPEADQTGNDEEAGPPHGNVVLVDGEEVFIPAESPIPQRDTDITPQPNHSHLHADIEAFTIVELENMTADTCLRHVLAIFPDISHEHVLTLYNGFETTGQYQVLFGRSRFENIVDKLASDKSYPKQEKVKHNKRKRENGDDAGDDRRWTRPDRGPLQAHRVSIITMLKADFPDIPLRVIHEELNVHTHFYQTYIALAHAKDEGDGGKKWRGRPSFADANEIATILGVGELVDELQAARKKVEGIRAQRVIDEANRQAEHENLQRAIAAGETAECQACFEDLPLNRQVYCDGVLPHFTCFDCITTYIKSEIGESRCRVLCTAGCGARYAPTQLHRLEDDRLLERLEQLQQEKDIRDAEIDDLEECPFCDYKAILPPVEVDFEFRCGNPECDRVSCRRCKASTHVPLSCEEYAKIDRLDSRHKVEEAMTAALVRSCNSCKKQFIKEFGCNKMCCPSCGHLQCYVCSMSLKDYQHFDKFNEQGNKCPLHDNVEERHEREVKEAEAAARAQMKGENPTLTDEDLEIKVSDAVTKAAQDRIRRANPHGVPLPVHGNAWPRVRPNLGLDGADDLIDENEVYRLPGLGIPPRPRRLPIRDRIGGNQALPNPYAQFPFMLEQHVQPQYPPAPPNTGRPDLLYDPALVQHAPFAPFNALGGMQGYIPVFGMPPARPPVHEQYEVHLQWQPQPQQQPQPLLPLEVPLARRLAVPRHPLRLPDRDAADDEFLNINLDEEVDVANDDFLLAAPMDDIPIDGFRDIDERRQAAADLRQHANGQRQQPVLPPRAPIDRDQMRQAQIQLLQREQLQQARQGEAVLDMQQQADAQEQQRVRPLVLGDMDPLRQAQLQLLQRERLQQARQRQAVPDFLQQANGQEQQRASPPLLPRGMDQLRQAQLQLLQQEQIQLAQRRQAAVRDAELDRVNDRLIAQTMRHRPFEDGPAEEQAAQRQDSDDLVHVRAQVEQQRNLQAQMVRNANAMRRAAHVPPPLDARAPNQPRAEHRENIFDQRVIQRRQARGMPPLVPRNLDPDEDDPDAPDSG